MIPLAPDYERHVESDLSLRQIWAFLNPLMLYGHHLGFPGSLVRKIQKEGVDSIQASHSRLAEIWKTVQTIMSQYEGSEVLRASAVYQYFPAASHGNHIDLYSSLQEGKPIAEFDFPRQHFSDGTQGLCLADYIARTQTPERAVPTDNLVLFLVSIGRNVRTEVEKLKTGGQLLKAHILQSLAIASVEGYAEQLHSRIRAGWKLADPPELTTTDLFQAKYPGKRYSFGHAACPHLEDQVTLFRLLHPEEIGVELTEGFMMEPEASISGIIFHHPEAKYFSVRQGL